jgi:hypothetical protein
MQGPYPKVKEKFKYKRKNFISYSYCLHRYSLLLGYTELLPCFTLLKCKDKLAKTKMVFDGILDELGWPYDKETGRFIQDPSP